MLLDAVLTSPDAVIRGFRYVRDDMVKAELGARLSAAAEPQVVGRPRLSHPTLKEAFMGAPGLFAFALAAKPLAPKVPLWILLIASEALDFLAFAFIGIKMGCTAPNPWILYRHNRRAPVYSLLAQLPDPLLSTLASPRSYSFLSRAFLENFRAPHMTCPISSCSPILRPILFTLSIREDGFWRRCRFAPAGETL